MNAGDQIRPHQTQEIVISFEIDRMQREPLAPVVGLREWIGLNHGAHGAVQDQNALSELLAEGEFQIAHHK